MTGEVTLRGRILPIGGLKEKVLAAHRGGIKTVLIPTENEKDLQEIPATILKAVHLEMVDHMDQVLKKALMLEDRESSLIKKKEPQPEKEEVSYSEEEIAPSEVVAH